MNDNGIAKPEQKAFREKKPSYKQPQYDNTTYFDELCAQVSSPSEPNFQKSSSTYNVWEDSKVETPVNGPVRKARPEGEPYCQCEGLCNTNTRCRCASKHFNCVPGKCGQPSRRCEPSSLCQNFWPTNNYVVPANFFLRVYDKIKKKFMVVVGPTNYQLSTYEEYTNGPDPIVNVLAGRALWLAALQTYEDDQGNTRKPGKPWILKGPIKYYPRLEAQIMDDTNVIAVQRNQGVLLRAKVDFVTTAGKSRKAGDTRMVQNKLAVFYGDNEEVVKVVLPYQLTGSRALFLRASQHFTDRTGTIREAGDEWMVSSATASEYLPGVEEEVIMEVEQAYLPDTQECLISYTWADGRMAKLFRTEGADIFRLPLGQHAEPGVLGAARLDEGERVQVRAEEKAYCRFTKCWYRPGEEWEMRGTGDYYFPSPGTTAISLLGAGPGEESEGESDNERNASRLAANEELYNLLNDVNLENVSRYVPFLKQSLVDPYPPAKEKAVEALLIFLRKFNYQAITTNFGVELASILIDKCLSACDSIKTKTVEALLLLIENGSEDAVVSELCRVANTHKVSSVSALCLFTLREAVVQFGFGPGRISPDHILPILEPCFDHPFEDMRTEAFALTVEVYRWMGPTLRLHIKGIHPVHQKELDVAFGKQPLNSGQPPVPVRTIKNTGPTSSNTVPIPQSRNSSIEPSSSAPASTAAHKNDPIPSPIQTPASSSSLSTKTAPRTPLVYNAAISQSTVRGKVLEKEKQPVNTQIASLEAPFTLFDSPKVFQLEGGAGISGGMGEGGETRGTLSVAGPSVPKLGGGGVVIRGISGNAGISSGGDDSESSPTPRSVSHLSTPSHEETNAQRDEHAQNDTNVGDTENKKIDPFTFMDTKTTLTKKITMLERQIEKAKTEDESIQELVLPLFQSELDKLKEELAQL